MAQNGAKALTISIVIPAYNEESYIGACLQAIAAQTDPPDQVIVVDNNSTDRTAQIVRQFDFVQLLREKHQGQVFGQATGFDAATGDIIGRIDADSVLPPDWVGRVKAVFADSKVAAFTGAPRPYDVPHKGFAVAAFQFYHDRATAWMAGHHLLYGTNCAFRGSLWPQVKPQLHLRRDIWEDYDLGFALAHLGKIVWVPDIIVGCSFRKFNEPFAAQMTYFWQAVRTFRLNTSWWRTALQGVLRTSIALSLPLMMYNRLHARLTARR